MEPARPSPERDPEFRAPSPPASGVPHHFPGDHQRLVANPFLGVAAFLLLIIVVSRLGDWIDPEVGLLLGIALTFLFAWLLPRLIHFHCRDCGTTGRLSAWKEHACAAVLGRRRAGLRPLFRGPPPPIQVVIWFYLVLAFAIAWNVSGRSIGRGPAEAGPSRAPSIQERGTRGADLSPIFLLD